MKILIILPTNIGDVFMGLPVLDRARAAYPQSEITVCASPRSYDLLLSCRNADRVILFNKRWPLKDKLAFIAGNIWRYHMIVDLKNSALPVLLGARKRTPFIRRHPQGMRSFQWYLSLTDRLFNCPPQEPGPIVPGEEERETLDDLGIAKGAIFAVPVARAVYKQYPQQNFQALLPELTALRQVVLLGEKVDLDYYREVRTAPGVVDLCGRTSLPAVCYLLQKYAGLVVAVDTGILHAASYCRIPVVGMFGPTDDKAFGPWSEGSKVVRNSSIDCAPCLDSHCATGKGCMDIDPQEIVKLCRRVIDAEG